jgi:hypothetical protein
MTREIAMRRSLLVCGVAACLLIGMSNAYGQKTIRAIARGTSTQLGRLINVDIHINSLSAASDQGALLEAFQADGSEGLANALEKMRSKGRIAITGTLGYDLNYIRRFKLPNGDTVVRFVTDRPVRFREAWGATRSMDYQITLGEIVIPKANPNKAKGTLMPATRVRLNKKGEIELENFQNPWQLTNIKIYN